MGADRRTFLRGLVTLPLIGGSVALIGSPVRAAVPTSPELLGTYADWLGLERFQTLRSLHGAEHAFRGMSSLPLYGEAYDWYRQDKDAPSTRAAVVLATVGCPLDT